MPILLSSLAGAAVCQQDESRKPEKEPPTVAVYATHHLGKQGVAPLLPWLRSFAGKGGEVDFRGTPGPLIVRADSAGHARTSDLLKWAADYLPVRVKVTITELHGDPKLLRSLAMPIRPTLVDQAAVTKFLRAATQLDGVRLRNHPPQEFRSGKPAISAKQPKAAKKKSAPKNLPTVDATLHRGETFLAKTWSPESPCVEMKCGQTLVVHDLDHGRLFLVRYDKVTKERREAQIIPIAPVRLKPGKKPLSPRA